MIRRPPRSTLFPYHDALPISPPWSTCGLCGSPKRSENVWCLRWSATHEITGRSEEHTSELQSRQYLVCRLLLEKKNNKTKSVKYSYTYSRSDEQTSEIQPRQY